VARRRAAAAVAGQTAAPRTIREGIQSWIDWYRDVHLTNDPPDELEWEPVKIGPTWLHDGERWNLPAKTLGWNVLGWCSFWLRDKHGNNWVFTPEQARLILWMYAVDDNGDFLYHSVVLQRLKGWGKDPLAACIALAECFAHVRFSHWDDDGNPVGQEEPNAWVQVVAVSQPQTKNTFKLFPSLISFECRRHYGIQVGKLNVYGLGDTRHIEAVTSSVLAIEGGRPTLTIRAETQNWNSSNGGHDMAGAMEGNAAKSEGGAARILDICNAYRPGLDSVGERAREAYEQTQSIDGAEADFAEFGVLYDSLEAPGEAPLTAEDAPAVVRSISGDSFWLDTRPRGRIVKSILNPQNPPSESRRKWFNQITAMEESWASPQDFDACHGRGIEPVKAKSEIVLFLDASKSDDATALLGCRIGDGHVFVVKIWQRPPRAKDWLVNRAAVDRAVTDCFNTYRVVGFWVDPSDARDDETGERYWENLCDEWARRYGRRLKLKAVRTGESKHAVIWDMRSKVHTKQFTEGCERTATDISEHTLTHDGHKLLTQHVRNARRSPNEWGVAITKEHRESQKKIDAAVAAVVVRIMWRFYLTQLDQQRQATKKAAINQQKVVVMGGSSRRAGSGARQRPRGR
jgi:hypothetical protein